MWKKFRTGLVCLMVLATPIQGFAAATMPRCGSGHHSLAALPEVPAHAGQADDAAAGARHHHKHDNHGHDHSDAAMPNAAAEQGLAAVALDQAADMKCSVCAACCSAAVIASSAVTVFASAASFAPVITGVAPPTSFITDGPSRPPPNLLA